MTGRAQQVIEIIAKQAMVAPMQLAEATRLDDLNLDSMALVEVIFGLEEAFDISLAFNANDPRDAQQDFATIAAVVAMVDRLIAQKAA